MPAVIERRRVAIIDDGLPTMPYRHESLGMREGEANALIARARRSIAGRTSHALRQVVIDLAPSYRLVALAIREPPFPELPDTVAVARQGPTSGPYSLKYYQFDAPGCDRPSGSASVLGCSDGYIDESCEPGRRRR